MAINPSSLTGSYLQNDPAYGVLQAAKSAQTAHTIGSIGGSLGGGAIGALVGTAVSPGVGTLIGGMIGGMAGNAVGNGIASAATQPKLNQAFQNQTNTYLQQDQTMQSNVFAAIQSGAI
jgi:phage tail tape-measure protein